MSAVRGRHDDMLIVRGVNLYPSQIEDVLLGVEGAAPHYQLVVERPQQLDEITVLCEGDGADLADRVRHAIREQIGVTVSVDVRAPGEIPRSEGKAVRVIDKR
jgi:phenylacetate-CoA ligase